MGVVHPLTSLATAKSPQTVHPADLLMKQQESALKASFTITLIKPSGDVARTSAANSRPAPLKGGRSVSLPLALTLTRQRPSGALPPISPPQESEALHRRSLPPFCELPIALWRKNLYLGSLRYFVIAWC